MRDRRTAIVTLVLLCALVLLLASDLRNAHVPTESDAGDSPNAWWIFYTPERVGSDFLAVLPHLPDRDEWHPQYRTISVGEAARRDGAGSVEEMIAPEQLELLVSEDPSAVSIEPLFRPHLRRLTAGTVRYVSYDPVLDDALIAEWRAEGLLTEYPRAVVLVAGGEGRYVLHTDSARESVYVVPYSLSPEGSAP